MHSRATADWFLSYLTHRKTKQIDSFMPIRIAFLHIAPLKTAGVRLFPEQIQTVKQCHVRVFANPPPCCKFSALISKRHGRPNHITVKCHGICGIMSCSCGLLPRLYSTSWLSVSEQKSSRGTWGLFGGSFLLLRLWTLLTLRPSLCFWVCVCVYVCYEGRRR